MPESSTPGHRNRIAFVDQARALAGCALLIISTLSDALAEDEIRRTCPVDFVFFQDVV